MGATARESLVRLLMLGRSSCGWPDSLANHHPFTRPIEFLRGAGASRSHQKQPTNNHPYGISHHHGSARLLYERRAGHDHPQGPAADQETGRRRLADGTGRRAGNRRRGGLRAGNAQGQPQGPNRGDCRPPWTPPTAAPRPSWTPWSGRWARPPNWASNWPGCAAASAGGRIPRPPHRHRIRNSLVSSEMRS